MKPSFGATQKNESSVKMTAPLPFPVSQLSSPQATELGLLVDLEARWENLRTHQAANRGKTLTRDELKQIQMAYDTFHGKLVAYNGRYKPVHVPELLLNNAFRFQLWCRSLQGLYAFVLQNDCRVSFPVHLLEKAYRCADRIADRAGKERFSPSRVGLHRHPGSGPRQSGELVATASFPSRPQVDPCWRGLLTPPGGRDRSQHIRIHVPTTFLAGQRVSAASPVTSPPTSGRC